MTIIPIDEYPIPFDRAEIIELQSKEAESDRPLIRKDSIIEGVDEFHDKYIEELARTDEYSVFKCHWGMNVQWIYFWNHQIGEGFKVDSDWETICPLVEMMDQFTDEYDSSDFEPNTYSWQLP